MTKKTGKSCSVLMLSNQGKAFTPLIGAFAGVIDWRAALAIRTVFHAQHALTRYSFTIIRSCRELDHPICSSFLGPAAGGGEIAARRACNLPPLIQNSPRDVLCYYKMWLRVQSGD